MTGTGFISCTPSFFFTCHLPQRLQEAETRNQELSQSVTSATRPLLRQIENLQASLGGQTASWEKLEKNISDRLGKSLEFELFVKQSPKYSVVQREQKASHQFSLNSPSFHQRMPRHSWLWLWRRSVQQQKNYCPSNPSWLLWSPRIPWSAKRRADSWHSWILRRTRERNWKMTAAGNNLQL